MAINKVIYGDKTLIDLTNSTVTADNLAEGAIAYGANGEQVVGQASFGSGGSSGGWNGTLTGLVDISDTFEVYDGEYAEFYIAPELCQERPKYAFLMAFLPENSMLQVNVFGGYVATMHTMNNSCSDSPSQCAVWLPLPASDDSLFLEIIPTNIDYETLASVMIGALVYF